MPDLLLLTSAEGAQILNKHIEKIGNRLRGTTAKALTDLSGDRNKVALYIIEHSGGDNIAPLQIIGLASFSWKRFFQLRRWKENLAYAWGFLSEDEPDLAERFDINNVEVWPLLVPGSWSLVAPIFRMRH